MVTAHKKISGFSLVELLVVISIIVILAAIGMTVYADAQSKARDARRKADVDSIAKSLELTKDSNGYQPLSSAKFGSSEGLPKIDPQGYAYCIKSSSNATDVLADTSASDWSSKNCVSNSSGTWWNVGNGLPGGTNDTPGANTVQWKVCTLLDNKTSIYCRYNVQ